MFDPVPRHDTRPSPSGRLAALASVLVLCALAASVPAPAGAQVSQAGRAEPVLSGEMAAVRAALDKYRDPLVAVREGYLSTLGCMDYPQGVMHGPVHYKPGAMGVHFLNLGNIGPVLDPAKPQVLMYEPSGDSLRLVAAEWFMPAQLAKEAPKIFGQTLQGPMDGHEPIMPADLRHYDLHVWLWRDNPAGTFEPTNAAVKCPAGPYSHAEGMAKGHAH